MNPTLLDANHRSIARQIRAELEGAVTSRLR